ncbi:MAG: hypothetical protein JWM16_91 [Verrucomicrobiales bacterium]|nr:hypothetical protein [Verrucomicrobiales bacterium]
MELKPFWRQCPSACLIIIFLLFTQACHSKPSMPSPGELGKEVAPGVHLVGHIANARITESSGIIQSTKDPLVFWTHNDGKRANLFGMTREGKPITEFVVVNAALHDWEEISTDRKGHIYIGDIGNNEARRNQIAVYEADEPDPKSQIGMVKVNRGWQLRFPKQPFDCESLFIKGGYAYVISKVFKNAKAELFRFPLTDQKEPVVLELVAQLRIDSPVTGACLSPDGKKLGIVSKGGAYVYQVGKDLSKLAKQKPYHTKFRHEHIEACTFVPEGLLATAESREIYLFTDEAFHP